jgi:hypothetical protein
MRTTPIIYADDPRETAARGVTPPPLGQRIGRRLLHEAREALPPTIFFPTARTKSLRGVISRSITTRCQPDPGRCQPAEQLPDLLRRS